MNLNVLVKGKEREINKAFILVCELKNVSDDVI